MSRIFLHPLVIMNIADHQARYVSESKNPNPKNPPRCLGAVFGTQTDKSVEVLSSIELPFKYDNEKNIRIDDDAFAEDTDLYKQIYPEHECLGWYSTSQTLDPQDLVFHKRFTEYNESPLYFRMNPIIKKTDKSLPITLYRMEMQLVNDQPQQKFAELQFKVVSDPSERLAGDHILRNKDLPTKGSQIEPRFDELVMSVKSLRTRIKLLIDYLDKLENKKIEGNINILQSIQAVTNGLPTMTSEKFREDFFTEMSNGMIMTYLSAMTKCASKVTDSMDLFDVNESRGGGRHRMMRRFAA